MRPLDNGRDTRDSAEPKMEVVKFKVAGIISNVNFQRGRLYALAFHHHLPKLFALPEICCFMGVEWTDYLTKCKRKFAGKYYELERPVATYVNDEFIGDDSALIAYISQRYQFSLPLDYEIEAAKHLKQILTEKGRTHIYMNICIDDVMVGSFIFRLYTDLVPRICANFIKLATKKRNGYKGSPIHRIVKSGWIQCGGFELKRSRKRLPCENYCIPHDRRGVLCMAHDGKHIHNNTQFFVTLNSTPFMDYKYVAFGQLVDGDNTLSKIEQISTYYETPIKKIQIVRSGVYTFDTTPLAKEQRYLEQVMDQGVTEMIDITGELISKIGLPPDILDPHDVSSEFNVHRYYKGLYCFTLDQGQLPKLPKIVDSTEEFFKHFGLGHSVLDSRDVPSGMTIEQYNEGKYFFELDQAKPPRPAECLRYDMTELVEEL